jgi:hypothetical protein
MKLDNIFSHNMDHALGQGLLAIMAVDSSEIVGECV